MLIKGGGSQRCPHAALGGTLGQGQSTGAAFCLPIVAWDGTIPAAGPVLKG